MNTDKFKSKLEEEKARLEKEMSGVARKNPGVPGDFEAVASEQGMEPDVVDQADTITSYETNEAIMRDLEPRYESVLAALARIEDGSYGKCMVDGGAIEEARLLADPAATTCKAHMQ